MTDPLPELAGRLRDMQDAPLLEHPDELEEVHDALVAELEEVGRVVADAQPDADSAATADQTATRPVESPDSAR